jgi:[acyl-carrier-protein] S-malonyltransferase
VTARKIAFAFGGQGSEFARAGHAWHDDAAFTIASEMTGVDIPRALDRLSRDLVRTSILQVALVCVSLAAHERLVLMGVRPSVVCGHSVGELAAWAATDAVDAREAITFAFARGSAMERAAHDAPGTMLSIEKLDAIDLGETEIAARNSPRQTVITGALDAIDRIRKTHGGRQLEVSGPWHSRAMTAAQDDTRRALEAITPRPMQVPLVTCLDGRILAPRDKPDFIAQLTSPVDWIAVARTLEREHVTDVVCVCPGRINRGLLRENFGARIALHLADEDADIDRIAKKFT